MKAWARAMVLVPAMAAGAASWAAADWQTGSFAAIAAWTVARALAGWANRVAAARFLAEAESPVPDVVEIALAARVGLDLGTVMEAKAAVKAAVRAVMVRRGAGLAALCAARAPSAAAAAPAPASVSAALAAAGSSAAGTAAAAGRSAAAAESPAAAASALPAGSAAAPVSAAEAAWKGRRDDVE